MRRPALFSSHFNPVRPQNTVALLGMNRELPDSPNG